MLEIPVLCISRWPFPSIFRKLVFFLLFFLCPCLLVISLLKLFLPLSGILFQICQQEISFRFTETVFACLFVFPGCSVATKIISACWLVYIGRILLFPICSHYTALHQNLGHLKLLNKQMVHFYEHVMSMCRWVCLHTPIFPFVFFAYHPWGTSDLRLLRRIRSVSKDFF